MMRSVRVVAWALSGSCVLLGLFGGCAGSADNRREEDVFLSALQTDIRLIVENTPRSKRPVVCVAIDPGDAPQSARKEFVARLKASAPRVVRSAECEVGADGVVEIANGRTAVLVTVGPVEWVTTDEAEVDVISTQSAARSMRRRYRIAYEAGRWVCLGQIMKISPA